MGYAEGQGKHVRREMPHVPEMFPRLMPIMANPCETATTRTYNGEHGCGARLTGPTTIPQERLGLDEVRRALFEKRSLKVQTTPSLVPWGREVCTEDRRWRPVLGDSDPQFLLCFLFGFFAAASD